MNISKLVAEILKKCPQPPMSNYEIETIIDLSDNQIQRFRFVFTNGQSFMLVELKTGVGP